MRFAGHQFHGSNGVAKLADVLAPFFDHHRRRTRYEVFKKGSGQGYNKMISEFTINVTLDFVPTPYTKVKINNLINMDSEQCKRPFNGSQPRLFIR